MERIMAMHRWVSAALMVALPAGGMADILKVPDGGPEVVVASDGPTRGMSMPQVEQRFGAPANRIPAVGQPPISRWDYRNYSVYFEHDRVLHAVAHQAQ
jgi:hypothetical protein